MSVVACNATTNSYMQFNFWNESNAPPQAIFWNEINYTENNFYVDLIEFCNCPTHRHTHGDECKSDDNIIDDDHISSGNLYILSSWSLCYCSCTRSFIKNLEASYPTLSPTELNNPKIMEPLKKLKKLYNSLIKDFCLVKCRRQQFTTGRIFWGSYETASYQYLMDLFIEDVNKREILLDEINAIRVQ